MNKKTERKNTKSKEKTLPNAEEIIDENEIAKREDAEEAEGDDNSRFPFPSI